MGFNLKKMNGICVAALLATVTLALGGTAYAEEAKTTVKDVTLSGQIDGENITFDLSFEVKTKEKDCKLELVRGDLIMLILPEVNKHQTVTYNPQTKSYWLNIKTSKLKFWGETTYRGKVKFACRPIVTEKTDWREVSFRLPTAHRRELKLLCDRADLEVKFPGAVRMERETNEGKLTVKALLGPGYSFKVQWKPQIQKLDARLVMSAECNTVARVNTGALRLSALFMYSVAQGRATELRFNLSDTLSVTQVLGRWIQDWKLVEAEDKPRELVVTLNRPITSKYGIEIVTESMLGEFPIITSLPIIEPNGVIRASGQVVIGTDSALKLLVSQPKGLSQIDPNDFELFVLDARKHPRKLPRSNALYYSHATTPFEAVLNVDNISSSYDSSEQFVVSVREDEMSIAGKFELDIRDAPLREVVIELDGNLVVSKVEGKKIADYITRPTVENSKRQELVIIYKEPQFGKISFRLVAELGRSPLGAEHVVGSVSVRGAKNERGYVVLAPDDGVDLAGFKITSAREIHTASLPRHIARAEKAYRFRTSKWSIGFAASQKPASIRTFTLHSLVIGDGITYGSVLVNYNITGAPINTLKFKIDPTLSNVEFVGADVRRRTQDVTDKSIWTVELQRKIRGAHDILVTFDQRHAESKTLLVGAVEPMATSVQSGYICLASRINVAVKQKAENIRPIIEIDLEEIPEALLGLISAPILKAYKYGASEHKFEVSVEAHERGELVGAVIENADIKTSLRVDNKRNVQSSTEVIYRIKNSREQFLSLKMPEGSKSWEVHQLNGAAHYKDGTFRVGNSKRLAASFDSTQGRLKIPLERRRNPEEPLTLRVKYVIVHPELPWDGELALTAPGCVIRTTESRWNVLLPSKPDSDGTLWVARPLGGTMTPTGIMSIGGLGGFVTELMGAWGNGANTFLGGGAIVVMLLSLVVMFAQGGRKAAAMVFSVGLMLFGLTVAARLDFGHKHTTQAEQNISVSFDKKLSLDQTEEPHVKIALTPSSRSGVNFSVFTVSLIAAITSCGLAFRKKTTAKSALVVLALGFLYLALAEFNGLWSILSWPFTWGLPLVLLLVSIRRFAIYLREKPLSSKRRPVPSKGDEKKDTQGDSNNSGVAVPKTLLLFALLLPILGGGCGSVSSRTAESRVVVSREGRAQKAKRINRGVVMPTVPIKEIKRVEYDIRARDDHMEIDFMLNIDTQRKLSLPIISSNAIYLTPKDEKKDKRLSLEPRGGSYVLEIKKKGKYELKFSFIMPLGKEMLGGLRRFDLKMPNALTNKVTLEIPKTDLEIEAPTAIYLNAKEDEGKTVASAIFGPEDKCAFLWRPRVRVTKLEKTVFFANITSLARCGAGVVDIRTRLDFQIAQGELSKLRLRVPKGMTVTALEGEHIGTWKFDPVTSTAEVLLATPATGVYAMTLVTQAGGGALPYEVALGLPIILDAERQRGSLGLASTTEVQIKPLGGAVPMNVDDFTRSAEGEIKSFRLPPNSIRSAYRFYNMEDVIKVAVSEIRAEIRVNEKVVFQIGDDKLAYNGQFNVDISKAGLFSISLLLPEGFDVDSLTSNSLSHWDDISEGGVREIKIHLLRKIMGRVNLQLAMSRVVSELPKRIELPRVSLKGASKHGGVFVVRRHLGTDLSVAKRVGVSELDPTEHGELAKRSMVFQILRPDWSVLLDTKIIEPRKELRFVNVARVSEGRVSHHDTLFYKVLNTGSKNFDVCLPEGVLDRPMIKANSSSKIYELRAGCWRVERSDKYMSTGNDTYKIELRYETAFDAASELLELRSSKALDAEMQTGALAVYSTEKVELTTVDVGSELHSIDARTIMGNHSGAAFCYASNTSDYKLSFKARRHDLAGLEKARVENINITTVITPENESITEIALQLTTAGLRYIHAELPANSNVWMLSVQAKTVVPSFVTKDGKKQLLIPTGAAGTEEINSDIRLVFVTTEAFSLNDGKWNVQTANFSLALHNIAWELYLPEGYEYNEFDGPLSLEKDEERGILNAVNEFNDSVTFKKRRYLSKGQSRKKFNFEQNTVLANEAQSMGNKLLQEGQMQSAIYNFNDAFDRTLGDEEANADIRGERQRAFLLAGANGLLYMRGRNRSETMVQDGKFQRRLTSREIKQSLNMLTSEEQENSETIARTHFHQQGQAIKHMPGLEVSIPRAGRVYRLTASLRINEEAPLMVEFEAEPKRGDDLTERAKGFLTLLVVMAAVFGVAKFMRK